MLPLSFGEGASPSPPRNFLFPYDLSPLREIPFGTVSPAPIRIQVSPPRDRRFFYRGNRLWRRFFPFLLTSPPPFDFLEDPPPCGEELCFSAANLPLPIPRPLSCEMHAIFPHLLNWIFFFFSSNFFRGFMQMIVFSPLGRERLLFENFPTFPFPLCGFPFFLIFLGKEPSVMCFPKVPSFTFPQLASSMRFFLP